MTNERAIELLHRISDSQFDGPYGDERREALSMAVRALEQNLVKESGDLVQDLVKDCISRQAAIDAVVSAMIDGADTEWVEVIRCKDCKHWREGDAYSYCQKLFNCGVLDVYDYMRAEDDFCSLAERREE